MLLIPILMILPGCDYLTAGSIDSYLGEIATIQEDSNVAMAELNQRVSELSGETAKIEGAIAGLEGSLSTIKGAYERIDALEVPEDARQLHEDLLELYLQGSIVVEDLIAAGRYQLAIEPIMTEYEAAASEFSTALEAAGDSDSLLAALRSYQTRIETITGKVSPLVPPTIASNSHRRFVANLETTSEGIADMIAGIEKGDLEAVEAASEKLASISSGNEQLEKDMLADRDADIKAYNAQIMEMSKLSQEIQRDQSALRERFETD